MTQVNVFAQNEVTTQQTVAAINYAAKFLREIEGVQVTNLLDGSSEAREAWFRQNGRAAKHDDSVNHLWLGVSSLGERYVMKYPWVNAWDVITLPFRRTAEWKELPIVGYRDQTSPEFWSVQVEIEKFGHVVPVRQGPFGLLWTDYMYAWRPVRQDVWNFDLPDKFELEEKTDK